LPAHRSKQTVSKKLVSNLISVRKMLLAAGGRTFCLQTCRQVAAGPDVLISVHVSAIKSWASELEALKSLWQKYPNDEDVFPTIITANL
jgi:hypothetical protein